MTCGKSVARGAALLRTGLKEMRTNQPWNWRLTVLKTVQMTLVRPQMTNFKMTVRVNRAVSACSAFLPSIKVLAHWLSVCREPGGGNRPLDRSPPSPHCGLSASKIKQTFHQPCLFIGFWAAGNWTPLLLVTVAHYEDGWNSNSQRLFVSYL